MAGTPGLANSSQPSRTAFTAAAARAAHLIVDGEPHIFADTLALALLGDRAEDLISFHREHGTHPVLAGARGQVTTRSRYTEDRLAVCAASGVTQYLILGAGLDSFAYRPHVAGQVHTFEADHPATQERKRELLAQAGIGVPDTITFVPVDIETGSLAGQLARSGFDPGRPALVSWLGVTMYLTRDAIAQTLDTVGGFAPGTHIVADYMLPAGLRDTDGDTYAELVGAASAEQGEPWLSLLSPADMSGLLEHGGFGMIEHVSQRDAIPAALWDRSDSLRPVELSRLAHATITGK